MEEQKTIPYDVGISFSKIGEAVKEYISPALDIITRLITEAGKISSWARKNRPHLAHLALHAKTARRREKNWKRIVKEYIREAV